MKFREKLTNPLVQLTKVYLERMKYTIVITDKINFEHFYRYLGYTLFNISSSFYIWITLESFIGCFK